MINCHILLVVTACDKMIHKDMLSSQVMCICQSQTTRPCPSDLSAHALVPVLLRPLM